MGRFCSAESDIVIICSAEGPIVGDRWSIRADGSAANPAELQKHLRGDPVAMGQLQQVRP